MKLTALFCCVLALLLGVTGCSSGSNPITVALSASTSQPVMAGQTVSVTATVAHDAKNAGVSWSLTGPGTLSGQTSTSVTYTAPTPVTATATATVTATSVSDSTKVATVTINLQPVSVTLAPSSPQTLDQGQTVALTASVSGDPSTKGVSWSLSGAGTLSGQTTSAATYNAPASVTSASTATITATSAFDSTKTQTLTINLVAPPSITTTSLVNGQVGTAYSASLAATNGIAPYTWSISGSLPAGLILSGSTISGTPTTAGTSNFTVQVKDGSGLTATKALSITVNQAPAITNANSTTFTINVAGTFSVTATGSPTPALTETGSLPVGVTFVDNGNGTATLRGTATVSGAFPVTITANNGIGTAATQSFTLTVGQPPAIASANNATFVVGSAGTFSVTTTGFPKPSLTETGALPSGVTFVDNGNGTATLSGTPAANTGGTYSISIKAHNGAGTDATQSFTLTVNQAPAITSANSASFTVNVAGTFTVTSTGFPTSALSETGALPTGVTFVDNGNGTATLSGTASATGTFTVTITASNSAGTNATQSFTLTIGQAAAITSAISTTFAVGSAGTFSVTTSGFPAPSLTETGAMPSGVTFVDNHNGTATLAGTPAANTGGAYSISIKAHNGIGTDATQSFTLTVNQTPSITSANNISFPIGALSTFSVATTGYPKPALTESGALPSGVTFVDKGNGTATLSGTPASGTNGTYSLTITANNGVSPNATQSFTLTVNTAAAITSGNATTFTVGTPGAFTVTATGTPTPSLTETGALPSGVTFVDNSNGTATLAGTPASGTGGTYSLSLKAHNGVGSDATQTFTLTVDQAPAITSTNSATFTINTAGTFTVTATGFPNVTLTETGALPSGVTFVPNGNNTATLSGTPTAGGSFPLTLNASNGVGTAATQSLTLTVSVPPLTLPTPNPTSLGSGTVNQSYSGSISASGGVGPFTFNVNGTVVPTNGSPVALSNGLNVSSTGGNTLTIGGTPTLVQTVSFPVSVRDSTSTTVGPDTYTIQVNSAGSQVNGQISLNNQCGGGSSTQPSFTVSINTTPVQTTTTDSSGNFSFATVPNGTYTITPSITGPSSVFYPATQSVTVNNSSPGPVSFSAALGYTVSGSVSYTGATTGRIYLNLSNNNCGGQGQAGTSIPAAGSFTIHGVPPGSYTLQAWMDPSTLAQGAQNAADPTGNVAVTVTTADATGANVTLADPSLTVPTTAPNLKNLIPSSQGAVISFGGGSVTNSNGVEEFTSYTVQWSTTTAGFSSSNSVQFKAIGRNSNVWILTNGMAGISGSLTSGTAYYFRVAGKNSAGTGPWTYWGGAGNSCSTTTCAVNVTISAPSGFTVSGTVTIPSDITPTGPLFVGFYDQSTNSAYAAKIASPSNSSPNSYTVTVPAGSNYFFFGILDQNNDGLIDAGDISNTNNGANTSVSISGNMTGENETLPDTNSPATVSTQFQQSTFQSGGGSQTSTNYGVHIDVREGNKLPVAVQLTSASNPNVITPVDISNFCQGCGSVQFDLGWGIGSDVPVVNDSYTFAVTYSDGTSASVVGKVTAVLATSQLVTNMAPLGTSSTSTTPTFTWTYPANPTSYTYQFSICCSSTGAIWQIPSQNSNSNGFTNTQIPGSLTWGVDPTDSSNLPTNSLTPGTQYNWQIQTQDANGNSATNNVWYMP
jgi:hypothetical protein